MRSGETTQCTTCQARAHIKNYSGYRFSKLTVLDEYEIRKNRTYWHCRCDCGNETWVSTSNLVSGEVKSCGCLSHRYNGPLEDLTNRTFNDLTVISEYTDSNHSGKRYWECQCICGNKTIVKTSDLTTGRVKSCGCRNFSQIPIGAVYGKLTVLKPTSKRASNGCIIYSCLCDCGNICEVPSSNLIRGDWRSCGCGRFISYGELDISQKLDNMGKGFERNKSFEDLTKVFRDHRQAKGRPPEFDFVVNDTIMYIIEFDGKQHFIPDHGWATEEKVLNTHDSDLIKNKYCFDNNILLIRIPYCETYDEKDLDPLTSRFVLTAENEKEYYQKYSQGFLS